MKKYINIEYGYENRWKGSYKIFTITPAISFVYNKQNEEFGCNSFEIYFEWLWFQLYFELEIIKKGSFYEKSTKGNG